MDDPLGMPTKLPLVLRARGPHPSTTLHCEFLCEEYTNFIDARFWVVLPLDQIQALNKDLRLSPMAVVKVEHNR